MKANMKDYRFHMRRINYLIVTIVVDNNISKNGSNLHLDSFF